MSEPKPKRTGRGRPKGSPNRIKSAGLNRSLEAIKSAPVVPLGVMLECLQDEFALYVMARDKVLVDGALTAEAPSGMEDFLLHQERVLEVAKTVAPYVHPKLANVDFVVQASERITVIRAPVISESAEKWQREYAPQLTGPTNGKVN